MCISRNRAELGAEPKVIQLFDYLTRSRFNTIVIGKIIFELFSIDCSYLSLRGSALRTNLLLENMN